VRIRSLEAESFRNLEPLRLEPHERFNIFEGANGQGKTNVLESIYLLGALRSFRESKVSSLVCTEASSAVVRGEVELRGLTRKLAVELAGNTRRAALDGNVVTRLGDYFGHLYVVVFAPDDLTLTKGAAGGRRRFIDRAIFNVQPTYLEETRAYLKALKHRNDLLRRPTVDPILLQTFDETLILHGSRILHRRLTFLESFIPVFKEVFGEITGGDHHADMRYQGGVISGDSTGSPSLDHLQELFAERLASKAQAEQRRGHTIVGPHSDDLILELDGHAARGHASQGQHRAFALALKIAELRSIRESTDTDPVLLLDDVSSELDEARNQALMAYLDQAGGQVFVTTTDRRWIQVTGDSRVYQVQGGEVTLSSG
jgi:DNA replication and repair protein RecF